MDPAQPTAIEIRVFLDVSGYEGEADEISKLVGLRPTRIRKRGERILESVMSQKRNRWILDGEPTSNPDLGAAVKALMRQVAPFASRFSSLPTNVDVQLYCVIHDVDRSVTLSIDPESVQLAASIGARLSIDYYNVSSVEPE
ncbi:MAG TPA: DUF4279 domain-containing protein [Dehalococcoidia bacterium]|nr:DUF4279 domain-containing protein [Dehalococcoidia bacterium]